MKFITNFGIYDEICNEINDKIYAFSKFVLNLSQICFILNVVLISIYNIGKNIARKILVSFCNG